MIRAPKALPQSTPPGEASGEFPEPIVTRPDRYWTKKNVWEADADPHLEISPETINFPSTLEASRSWEALKLPILCSTCTDQKIDDTFHIDKLHWKYVHCTKCPKFFSCAKCTERPSGAIRARLETHRSHGKLVTLQSRPFWAPLYDGSDLDQLQAFLGAKTDNEFFLYFPWYFHCFEGMEIVRLVYQRWLAVEALAAASSSTADQNERIEIITRFFQAPVDWNARIFATGNWQQLQQQLQPLTKEKIHIAKSSLQLNSLLERLHRLVEEKARRHGPGDIACLPSARAVVPSVVSGNEFIAYLMPLHFMTILNDRIDRKKMDEVLYSDYSSKLATSSSRTSTERNLVSAGDSGFALSQSHLSNPVCPEKMRLWRIFQVLFDGGKDDERFKELEEPTAVNDLIPWVEYAAPEWKIFLDEDAAIRKTLHGMQYQAISKDVEYLVDPTDLPNSRSGLLGHFHLRRVLGNYEHAIAGLIQLTTMMRALRLPHLELILEAQLNFLEQGYLEKAMACLQYTSDDINLRGRTFRDGLLGDSTSACIVAVSSYAGCFVRGNWNSALRMISGLFNHFCKSSGGNNRKNDLSELLNRVLIELMFHKIVLAVYRDIRKPCPRDATIARLQSIQDCLAKRSEEPFVAELLWQTISLELEMKKRGFKDQYLELEACFNMQLFVHMPQDAIPVLNRAKALFSGDDAVSKTLQGHASLLEAGILKEMKANQAAGDLAKQALSLYEETGSEVGCLDVQLSQANGNYSELGPIYDKLRARNDLSRLRPLRKLPVKSTDPADEGASKWRNTQRASLRDLAAEAGDNIAFHRWNMRKYASDTAVGASIKAAEAILKDSVVHSSVLATLASFNLSKAYLTLGNYFSAALNSMLHLSLVIVQDDAEDHQRAVLAVLDVFSAAIAADPRLQQQLPRLGELWKGWLDDNTIHRWAAGYPRCDEIERFIDGACFLPLLAGRVEREPKNGILGHNTEFEETLINHLRIAFDLYTTMPSYTAAAIVPRLSRALGATAAYVGNFELAIRCFWEGIRCCHSGDKYSTACLRIDAAKLMVRLGERDPEHWLHVVAPGRNLLTAAAETLRRTVMAGSMLKSTEANLHLLESLVGEARAWKTEFDNEIEAVRSSGDQEPQISFEKLEMVVRLLEKSREPLLDNERVFGMIAERVSIASPFELNYNLVTLAENPIFSETRQLGLEIGLICADIDQLAGKQRHKNLWELIQTFKGTVLGYQYSRLVPGQLIESIKSSHDAWTLYQEEKALIDEGPQNMYDPRLIQHQLKMSECDELMPLLRRRFKKGVTMEELTSLAQETVQSSRDLILIDWILYRGHFLIVGFNASAGKIFLQYRIHEISVLELESWIEEHLGVSGEMLIQNLDSMQELKSLHHLVKAISLTCSPGAVLVFSPSLCLNRIPLHAIPYAHEDDHPIIHYHPIVYVPSNSILKECVGRALSMDATSTWQAKLFDCYDTDERSGAEAIDELASTLRWRGASTVVASGDGVNPGVLKETLPEADILHFHGHVKGQNLGKYLAIGGESSAESSSGGTSNSGPIASEMGPGPSQHSFGAARNSGDQAQQTSPAGFGLQDVYAANLRARLVVLMGCGSGELVVSRGDDALGLVNGFLAAGAASVVGTLWPLGNEDAREFSGYFYRNAFAAGKDSGDDAARASGSESNKTGDGATVAGLVDLATALQRAVTSMRRCTKEKCQRKSPEKRLSCHGVAPYRWAPFVAWGSFVFQEPRRSRDEKSSTDSSGKAATPVISGQLEGAWPLQGIGRVGHVYTS